jgi:ribosomal protein L37AE/L43A
MKTSDLRKELSYHRSILDRALNNSMWESASEEALKIYKMCLLADYTSTIAPKVVDAINNSSTLNQAECPECGKPFSRGVEAGTHKCEGCGAVVQYKAFTTEEILDSLIDEGE